MTYPIDDESDARTKVVRSSEGIVIIPKLGMRIEPTGDASTWIRNIEGILEDLKDKLLISLKYADTTEEKRIVKQRIRVLRDLKQYRVPFKIIVEDASGNSLILPVDASKLDIQVIENSDSETD